MKSLLIIGECGHGSVVAETAAACGYEKIDFLDDSSPEAVGKTDQLEELAKPYDAIVEDLSHINTGAIVGAGKRASGKVEAGEIIK